MKTHSLSIGDVAPDFSLVGDDGQTYSLHSFAGKNLILYFYPKDETPTCTKEACEFRDMKKLFEQKQAIIVGISPDDTESHVKFKKNHELSFLLLSDPQLEVAKSYGAYGEKNFYGKKSMGLLRKTFIIDTKKRIHAVIGKVSIPGHADEILALLDANPS